MKNPCAEIELEGLTYSDARAQRIRIENVYAPGRIGAGARPNCDFCVNWELKRAGCPECLGSDLAALPWTELFKDKGRV